MKRLLIALALLLAPSIAWAQCNGIFANNTVCGNITGSSNLPRPTNPSAFLGAAGGAAGQIQYNNSGALGGFTASGDATINTSTGAVAVTKTGGVAFAPSATTDTTNASNISSGTLNTLRLPSPYTSGTASGNTSKFVTTTGTLTNGDCVKFDSNGNAIANGYPCGSYILLTTLTASNSATLSDTTIFTSTYSAYELVFENIIPATGSTSCEIQVYSGGAYQTTTYLASVAYNSGAGAGQAAVTTYIPCNSVGVGATSVGINGQIRIHTPSSTTNVKMWNGQTSQPNSAGTNLYIAQIGGYWSNNAAITGFRMFFSSGNITSGDIKIYGIL